MGLFSPPVKEEVKDKKPKGLFATMKAKQRAMQRTKHSDKGKKKPQVPVLVPLNSEVDLSARKGRYGLVERVAAVESLAFLVRVLNHSQKHIKGILPHEHRHRVTDLVTYGTSVSREFRRYMFRNLAPLVVPGEAVLRQLRAVDWAVDSIQTQSNEYVSLVLVEMKHSRAVVAAIPPLADHPSARQLWQETLEYVTEKLVQGLSRVERCTSEGRSWMMLDLRELKAGLEALTGNNPLPGWDYVNEYVVAFFYGSEELLTWILQHPHYSLTQYQSLASLGACNEMNAEQTKAFLGRVEAAYKENCAKEDKDR